jgi:hypothetical protein
VLSVPVSASPCELDPSAVQPFGEFRPIIPFLAEPAKQVVPWHKGIFMVAKGIFMVAKAQKNSKIFLLLWARHWAMRRTPHSQRAL